jgi:integrase
MTGILSYLLANMWTLPFSQKEYEANSFAKMRFHDLRHTMATILLESDVHPKKVQERLGHRMSTILVCLIV